MLGTELASLEGSISACRLMKRSLEVMSSLSSLLKGFYFLVLSQCRRYLSNRFGKSQTSRAVAVHLLPDLVE
jgi:hypothetical protein